MPHFVREEGVPFISPSQDEVLETIAAFDGAHRAAGCIDETPSQFAYLENSSENSRDRVFDVTGSSMCSGASQEAVELISPDLSSPRTGSDAPVREQDSYNEAFESDRSQSPSRTLSWNLPAANRVSGKDPKSPVSGLVVTQEVEKPPEAESSKRPSVPPEAGDRTDVRTESAAGKAPMTDGEAEESSGRREPAAISTADAGGVALKSAGFEVVGRSNGVPAEPPRELPSAGEIPASKPSQLRESGGSGSAAAGMSKGRKENDFQAPNSGERPAAFGIEGGTCALSVANAAVQDSLDQMAHSVQANMQVLDNMVVENESPPEETTAEASCKRRRCSGQHELDNFEKVGERAGRKEVEFTASTALRDELENSIAALHLPGAQVGEIPSGREKSGECLVSPTDVEMGNVDKPGATAASEDAGQRSPATQPRPPKAVQEKLDKLRSQNGNRTPRSESSDLVGDCFRMELDNVSARRVLEAIKRRSGEKSVGGISARDLLRIAVGVGITLPSPFHRSYFSA